VLDWASLFQSGEETRMLESNEIAQYSYTRLIREMEAAESDIEDEEMKMVNDSDEEMVRIPGDLLDKLAEQKKVLGLPENLYMLPELVDQNGDKVAVEVLDHSEKNLNPGKGKWGPILIEKRPCKKPLDGRTIMEKAQYRKDKLGWCER
jgi:hypothetical protein